MSVITYIGNGVFDTESLIFKYNCYLCKATFATTKEIPYSANRICKQCKDDSINLHYYCAMCKKVTYFRCREDDHLAVACLKCGVIFSRKVLYELHKANMLPTEPEPLEKPLPRRLEVDNA